MSEPEGTKKELQEGGTQLIEGSRYFKHDNAIFRQRPSKLKNRIGIDEVLHGNKWVPYKGDRLEPGYFGREVDLSVVLAWMED